MRRIAWPLLAAALLAGGCKEEGVVTVRSIEFVGVTAVDSGRLKAALATRQSAKLPWGRKYAFDRSRFDADLKRIEAFYADRGYPDAHVTGVEVKPTASQDSVDITVSVAEGEPVLVAAVQFAGFDVIPSERLESLRRRLPLAEGRPRDRQLIVSARDTAANELRDSGYPYARVTASESDTGKLATLTLTAEPGPLAHFGEVEIAGNQTVGTRVIARQLTFRPGDLYRRSLVQDSQRRLYGMQLFQFVNIETLDPDRQDPVVRMRVTVAEGRHQRVNLGVGYGTEEKARVDAGYHHVNFLGGARTAGLRARASSLDRGVRLEFNQPYVLRPHASLGAEAQHWLTFTPAYDSTITGARVTLMHRESQMTSWAVSFLNERDNSTISESARDDPALRNDLIALGLDPETGHQDGTLNAVGVDIQRSTADNLLNATRGYQLALHGELAGKAFPGQYRYTALTADARYYLPIGGRLSLGNRVQFGTIEPLGDDAGNVPFSKKYFLGGSSSIRGWGRFEVSPLGTSGFPVGGNTLFAFTSEARVSIVGGFGGVVFLDGGNVWAPGWTVDTADLRYAAGLGLRYGTAVGPLRFDVGRQLNPIDGLLIDGKPQERSWRIHFSIGQAF
jgi:translocation and assembly module TamA